MSNRVTKVWGTTITFGVVALSSPVWISAASGIWHMYRYSVSGFGEARGLVAPFYIIELSSLAILVALRFFSIQVHSKLAVVAWLAIFLPLLFYAVTYFNGNLVLK